MAGRSCSPSLKPTFKVLRCLRYAQTSKHKRHGGCNVPLRWGLGRPGALWAAHHNHQKKGLRGACAPRAPDVATDMAQKLDKYLAAAGRSVS